MAIYTEDIKSLIENPMVQEKYLTSENPEIFIEIDGILFEPSSMFYKEGHLVIRNLCELGKTEDINLSLPPQQVY